MKMTEQNDPIIYADLLAVGFKLQSGDQVLYRARDTDDFAEVTVQEPYRGGAVGIMFQRDYTTSQVNRREGTILTTSPNQLYLDPTTDGFITLEPRIDAVLSKRQVTIDKLRKRLAPEDGSEKGFRWGSLIPNFLRR